MDIKIKKGCIEKQDVDGIILGMFEKEKWKSKSAITRLDNLLGGLIKDMVKSGEFKGKINEVVTLPTRGDIPARRVILVGLGKKNEFKLDSIRQVSGKSTNEARRIGLKRVAVLLTGDGIKGFSVNSMSRAYAEGALLSIYKFDRYKTEKDDTQDGIKELWLIDEYGRGLEEAKDGVKVGRIIAESANFARDLANQPANELPPVKLADAARRLARECGLASMIFDERKLKKLKMNALLGVAQGSDEPPRFIILEYNKGEKKKGTVVLAGKAITFDSGGISLKPSEKMEEMKYDKSGGSAIIGVMRAVALLRLPLHVIGLIPATENLPGGSALKPGDVLKSFSGKTIEIISTDAEGRLILADALSYADRFKPDAIIDIATLTGACVIALGHNATGILGNDEGLLALFKEAGERSGERVWELPLWKEYDEQIKSDIADVKNVGGRPAGTITGAAFLKKFLPDLAGGRKTPWAHLDIAGTAWKEKEGPYLSKGATGVGVRLLVQFLMDYADKG
mgnify:CR=1 FL=1